MGTYAISTYIPVEPNAFHILSQKAGDQSLVGNWYDSNKNFISDISGYPYITSPGNAAFVRLNINKTLTFSSYSFVSIIPSLSGWSGKKANFLGDSITEGYPGIATVPTPYPELVKSMLGLNVARNYGKSGSDVQGVNGGGVDSFITRYPSMDNDADLIFVFGGTNDFGHNLPLGTSADITNISFYGALNVLMTGLVTKYPTQTIVFATPLHRYFADSGTPAGETNNSSVTLLQYANAIKETAQKYGIPVLDLYSNSGIQPSFAHQKAIYTTDGLHPKQKGHQVIASKIVGFLNTL